MPTAASSAARASQSAPRTPSASTRTPTCPSWSRCAQAVRCVGTSAPGGLRYEALWPPSTVATSEDAAVQPGAGPLRLVRHLLEDQRRPAGRGSGRASWSPTPSGRSDDRRRGGRRRGRSALLIGLLAAGEIDGALVLEAEPRPRRAMEGRGDHRDDRRRVRAAAGSFYNQTMALAELDLSGYRCRPSRASPWLARLRGARPARHAGAPVADGAHRVDAVVLTIALMCTKTSTYEAPDAARAARQARCRPGPCLEDGRRYGAG